MKYPPHLLDEIRARLSVSQVVSRKVALKRAGREFRGLSPFKVEKTPSFFVNDQKGFFHCFASGEHGDIFGFVMKTEGLSFPEAVEQLAAEAGVALPKPDVRDHEREDRRERLYKLLEASARFYEKSLAGAAGEQARRYITGRGLRRDTIATFRIGYAPGGRSALKDQLTGEGFSPAEMIEAGMLIGGEDIATPYDRFRNRVMFPITDLKGRIIAFGGRALEKDVPAKYLNSPETPLFHKGAILFNAARARPLAYDRKRVIVVEGYMDVVALSEAGFGESVAPLGTALTEDQMQIVWRMVPEPTLCFDGDGAGKRAAWRAIDIILPGLQPGVSANFAFLPDGLDPDDLIRQQGAPAMQAVLQRARPLADVLWEREFAAGDWSTPERRAQLDGRISALVGRIVNPAVKSHYGQAMRDRLAQAWGQPWKLSRGSAGGRSSGAGARDIGNRSAAGRPAGSQWRGPRQGGGSSRFDAQREPWRPSASISLRQSGMVEGDAIRPPYREALMMRALLNHPWLLEHEAEAIAGLEFASAAMSRLRDALLALLSDNIPLDREQIRSQLERASLDKVTDLVERAITHRSDRFAEPDADAGEVERGWRHTVALHDRQTGLRKALQAAERLFNEDGSEDALARIIEIKRQLTSSEHIELPTE